MNSAFFAVLLLVTPSRTFSLLVPWLLLFATVIFGFSKPIARWAGRDNALRVYRLQTDGPQDD